MDTYVAYTGSLQTSSLPPQFYRHGSSHFAMSAIPPKSVDYKYQDRQWDARFNVQTDEDYDRLLAALQREWDAGKFRYVLCGGIEVGTRPNQTDYQTRHVHCALIFHNRVSKSSILKNLDIKEGNGYYLVPRNRDLPYSGWRTHHIKEFSKLHPTKLIAFEMGELPNDEGKKPKQAASDLEKKRKIDEVLVDMRTLLEEGKEDEAFVKYPRNYLIYGERLKAMVTQKRDFFNNKGDPHIWLHGFAGAGKTAILSFVYPMYFKKNLHNKFFDLYDPKVHTHVMLEDLDHEAVERLSINFLKTLCDEAGFAVDQKYKTPQLARTTVLVTSNFEISDLINEGPGIEENKKAMYRRFWHIRVDEFMRVLGLKLVDKSERWILKKAGNTDLSKLFIPWDYKWNLPSCEPLKTPEEYQAIIRDAFYK